MGACTLGAEIAAARLLAPWFGASTVVWANTIAVVLVALAIGYWLGGRMADRRPMEAALRRWVLAGAALLAVVPVVARPFLEVSTDVVDGELSGSLVAVLCLLSVPLVVLGAVAPWAIRLSVTRLEDAAAQAGRLYAVSTVGSLVGTFASALVLLPLIGTQRTFVGFALALAAVAAWRLPGRYLLAPVAIAGLLAIPPQS